MAKTEIPASDQLCNSLHLQSIVHYQQPEGRLSDICDIAIAEISVEVYNHNNKIYNNIHVTTTIASNITQPSVTTTNTTIATNITLTNTTSISLTASAALIL